MEKNAPSAQKISRPPIVVVMGHIDHGKSSLLDYIRKTNVVAGESGGITQHLSAYEAEHVREGKKQTITFLDTPGHEAFASMRARGASVADIAILVVSAEDGVKPQTKEALAAILAANIPFVVAINKIDKPNANVERVKRELGDAGVYLEGLGGEIPYVAISAKVGTGVPELLDVILLVADLKEFTGDLSRPAEGFVIESRMDPKRGVTATVIITNGTLSVGNHVVAGCSMTPVRALVDSHGAQQKLLHFSAPAVIAGWSELPPAGSPFVSVETKKDAEAACEEEKKRAPEKMIIGNEGAEILIPVIVNADVAGTLEAVLHELKKVPTDRVALKVISKNVGNITESDVKLAAGSPGSIIVGFRVDPEKSVISQLEATPVSLKTFTVIYELTDFLKEEAAKRTPRQTVEEVAGRAKILRVFSATKNKQLVGGRVNAGKIPLNAKVNILRRDNVLGEGKIVELQQARVATKEVLDGEFGVVVESKIEITEGDVIEAIISVTR